jgi:hypothetical protein
MNALNQIINCFVYYPISSICVTLFTLLIFSWVFWHLRRDWQLHIKDSKGWHLIGVFDSPASCYDYLEKYPAYNDYKLVPILKTKYVKQISKTEQDILKQEVLIQELLENTKQVKQSQEQTIAIIKSQINLNYDLH